MYVRVLTLSTVFLSLSVCAAFAQSYSGAWVQQLVVTPGIQSLGEATVGLRGYVGAAQLNPASIGRRDVVQGASAFHPDESVFLKTPWLPGVFSGIWMVAPAIDIKLNDWALGYMYREMSFGEQEGRDAQNNPTRTFRVYESVHKLTAAYDVLDRLTVGISVNLVSDHLVASTVGRQDQPTVSALSFDLGLLYAHPLETPHVRVEPAVGWSLTDFGSKLDFDSSPAPLPMTMRGGVAVRLSSQRLFLSRPLVSLTLLGGLSQEIEQVEVEQTPEGPRVEMVSPFVALFTGWRSLNVQSSWVDGVPQFESVNAWEQMRRHAGLEITIVDVLFLRWGTQYEHPRLGTRDFASRGWGIDLYYVAFERATAVGRSEAYVDYTTSTLTIRVPLRRTPDNFWIPFLRRFRQ